MIDLNSIKCVAFDADNTLYSTKKIAKDADMAAMEVLASASGRDAHDLYEIFFKIVSEIKYSIDPKVRHRRYSYSKVCENIGGVGSGVLDKMYEAFEKVVEEKIEIVPGIKEILETLKDKKLFVITEDNREMALKKLSRLDIRDKFDAIITSDDTGTMKPSKLFYAEVISTCKPAEAIVLGDNYEKDLAIPEKLGMKTFLVDNLDRVKEFETLIKQG